MRGRRRSSRSGASRVSAMRALARHGRVWAPLGARVLARSGSVLVKGVHELLQESERDVQDTTVQARSER